MKLRIEYLATTSLLVSCASTPGAQPHDASQAQHESAARQEDRSAQEHLAQYDPNACYENCSWSRQDNQTNEHLEDAERHQKAAADHRAASRALGDAERAACRGIAALDRDMSPFDHRDEISSVEPLTAKTSPASEPRIMGAVVAFRPLPRMSAVSLQRIVDCHLARNAAVGNKMPEMPYCPLVPRGVHAKVSTTSTGLVVTIDSDDSASAMEVYTRAKRLVAP
jgi:hypothetical protein